MFKWTKWLVLAILTWPIMFMSAFAENSIGSSLFKKDHQSQPQALVDFLQSQDVKIILNGQSFSMFIPVEKLFVAGSTNMKPTEDLTIALHNFIAQYDPDNVTVIGRYEFDVTPREKDLVREQAILVMKSLDLKAPGRIIASGLEGMYDNSRLNFWQEVKTTRLIEVRWESKLKVEYMVLNEGKTSK